MVCLSEDVSIFIVVALDRLLVHVIVFCFFLKTAQLWLQKIKIQPCSPQSVIMFASTLGKGLGNLHCTYMLLIDDNSQDLNDIWVVKLPHDGCLLQKLDPVPFLHCLHCHLLLHHLVRASLARGQVSLVHTAKCSTAKKLSSQQSKYTLTGP